MKSLLLVAATFSAVYVAPQAMAQSCNALLTNFEKQFQTQPNDRGNPWISVHTATSGADGVYVGHPCARFYSTMPDVISPASEAAEVMGVSPTTVKREWRSA